MSSEACAMLKGTISECPMDKPGLACLSRDAAANVLCVDRVCLRAISLTRFASLCYETTNAHISFFLVLDIRYRFRTKCLLLDIAN